MLFYGPLIPKNFSGVTSLTLFAGVLADAAATTCEKTTTQWRVNITGKQ